MAILRDQFQGTAGPSGQKYMCMKAQVKRNKLKLGNYLNKNNGLFTLVTKYPTLYDLIHIA